MNCPVCWELKRAYEAEVSEFAEVRSSACFRVCPDIASPMIVEVERARYELEEHRRVCASAVRVVAHPPGRAVSANLKQRVAWRAPNPDRLASRTWPDPGAL